MSVGGIKVGEMIKMGQGACGRGSIDIEIEPFTGLLSATRILAIKEFLSRGLASGTTLTSGSLISTLLLCRTSSDLLVKYNIVLYELGDVNQIIVVAHCHCFL